MITEDYVSSEIAQLLKEKGFDSECDYLYVNGNIVRAQGGKYNWNKGEAIFNDYKNECSAPTLQMVMKWLREMHNITIGITFSLNIITYEIQKDEKFITAIGSSRPYEDMLEEAIKYCLENLI